MFTLESVKGILEFMGLLIQKVTNEETKPSSSDKTHYLRNIIFTIPLLLLLFPLCAYFYFNISNLINATDVFYVIASTTLCIGQYWFLVMQKLPLQQLLVELQELVDQSNTKTHKIVVSIVLNVLFGFQENLKTFKPSKNNRLIYNTKFGYFHRAT